MNKTALRVILVMVLCCGIMAFVDGVLRPAYGVKSAIKASLFLLLPFILSRMDREVAFSTLFRFQKKGFGIALLLGVGIYACIIGGYFLVRPYFDFSGIVDSLSQNAGVGKNNFLFVSLYISFVNSLLEEFFFRGFGFVTLSKTSGKHFAHLFSAGMFSLYHTAMMIGWFSPVLFLLVMAGLFVGGMIFNTLNEKLGSIYPSWLTHMFANFAINTIGFTLMA